MSRKYFGTDGIRGLANRHPMTSEVALRVGMAAGKVFSNGGSQPRRVVIGKDTRLSGYMIESALMSGFTAVGMHVFLLRLNTHPLGKAEVGRRLEVRRHAEISVVGLKFARQLVIERGLDGCFGCHMDVSSL